MLCATLLLNGAQDEPGRSEAEALKREAVATAEMVAAAYPNDALAYALLGSAQYNTGKSDEATRYLLRCIELQPDQADAYEILARVAYERGEPEQAVRFSQEALKRNLVSSEILNRLGRALMDLGRTDEALPPLERAVRLPKPVSESWHLLGQCRMQSGNPAEAKQSFLKAIALLPDHTQAYFGLYTACLRLGQEEEAARYREEFLKLEAIDRQALRERSDGEEGRNGLAMVRVTVARTFFGAAQIHAQHRESAKAAELFRLSAALDATNPVYRSTLETFYVKRKELAEGIKVFEGLIAEQPENAVNYLFLGRLQSRMDRFEDAERAFKNVCQFAPKWSEGYRSLAELYLRANRQVDQALIPARRAVELEPAGPQYYWLAVALLKNGDKKGALTAVQEAQARNPGDQRYEQLRRQLQPAP